MRLSRLLLPIAAIAVVGTLVAATLVTFAQVAASPPLDDCHEVVTQELYVQHAYACEDGARVVTFAGTDARDAYLKVAEYFGTVTLDRGDRWARIR